MPHLPKDCLPVNGLGMEGPVDRYALHRQNQKKPRVFNPLTARATQVRGPIRKGAAVQQISIRGSW